MVVAGMVDRAPERIAHVVYFDADVPRAGESSAPPSTRAAREAVARADGDRWRVPPEVTPAEALLLGELPEDRRRWIAARFTPQPLKTWTQPVRLMGAAAAIPTTYVRCTVGYDPADEDTRRQDDRIRSEPEWRYWVLAESHAAPFTAPRAVAGLLLEAVSAPMIAPAHLTRFGKPNDQSRVESGTNPWCPPEARRISAHRSVQSRRPRDSARSRQEAQNATCWATRCGDAGRRPAVVSRIFPLLLIVCVALPATIATRPVAANDATILAAQVTTGSGRSQEAGRRRH